MRLLLERLQEAEVAKMQTCQALPHRGSRTGTWSLYKYTGNDAFPTAPKVDGFLEDGEEKNVLLFHLKVFRENVQIALCSSFTICGLKQTPNSGYQTNPTLESPVLGGWR